MDGDGGGLGNLLPDPVSARGGKTLPEMGPITHLRQEDKARHI